VEVGVVVIGEFLMRPREDPAATRPTYAGRDG
jgi:hypothetical protein